MLEELAETLFFVLYSGRANWGMDAQYILERLWEQVATVLNCNSRCVVVCFLQLSLQIGQTPAKAAFSVNVSLHVHFRFAVWLKACSSNLNS